MQELDDLIRLRVVIAQTQRPGEPALSERQLQTLIMTDVEPPEGSPLNIERKIECAIVSGDPERQQRTAREVASMLHVLREKDPRVHKYASDFLNLVSMSVSPESPLLQRIESPRVSEINESRQTVLRATRRRRRMLPWTLASDNTCTDYNQPQTQTQSKDSYSSE